MLSTKFWLKYVEWNLLDFAWARTLQSEMTSLSSRLSF